MKIRLWSPCVLPWLCKWSPSFPSPGTSCIFLWLFHTSRPCHLPGQPIHLSVWWVLIHSLRCDSSCTSSVKTTYTLSHPLRHTTHYALFLPPSPTGVLPIASGPWLSLESSEDLLTPMSGTWAGKTLITGAPQETSLFYFVSLCQSSLTWHLKA